MTKQQESALNDLGKIIRNMKAWTLDKVIFTPNKLPHLTADQMRCAESVASFGVSCVKPKDEKK